MPVDKEVQDHVELVVLRAVTALADRVDHDCRECRHAIKNDMAVIQGAAQERSGEMAVLGGKLDTLTTSVERLTHIFDGDNNLGSMDARMRLMERDLEASTLDRHALHQRLEELLTEKKQTWKQLGLQIAPVLVSWLGTAALILIYLAMTHAPSLAPMVKP